MNVKLGAVLVFVLEAALASHAGAASTFDALVVGGGCEDVGSSTKSKSRFADSEGAAKGHANLFRPQFESAYQSLREQGWQVEAHYDGDVWQKPWPGVKDFQRATLLEALRSRAAKLKAGDQFLLAIASHGESSPKRICLGNGQWLKVSELNPLIEKLVKKGVRVGVIDDSCYSGGTLDALKSTGACVLSSTSPNTTSAGDGFWNAIFGPGLKPGTELPSIYQKKLPPGSADRDSNGVLTLAEAFAWSALHESGVTLPRSSECTLSDARLRQLLSDSTLFLRNTSSVKAEYDETPIAPGSKTACAIAELPEVFRKIHDAAQAPRRKLVEDELRLAGYSGPALSELITELKERTDAMTKLVKSIHGDEELLDRQLAKGEKISDQSVERISRASKEAGALKVEIFKRIRPLVFAACRLDRLNGQPKATACEAFELHRIGENKQK